MKLVVCAGPPTVGKTSVLRQVIRRLIAVNSKLIYLKYDVLFADDVELIGQEFGIITKTVYSGDMCPDHCGVQTMGNAIEWAKEQRAEILLVETAGLCLRCSPYIEGSLGVCVLEATSGTNLPRKVGPMLSWADVCIVTKMDRVSQAERDVFRYNVLQVASKVVVIEVDALHGIHIDHLVRKIMATPELGTPPYKLSGCPPLGTCTVCAGEKRVGRSFHRGTILNLDTSTWEFDAE